MDSGWISLLTDATVLDSFIFSWITPPQDMGRAAALAVPREGDLACAA
jgi:hypothetical protein